MTSLLELPQIVETLVPLKRTNQYNYCGPCPWCGGRDRFAIKVVDDTCLWNCRGCLRSGTTIDFVKKFYQKSYREALEFLGLQEFEIKIQPRRHPLPEIHYDVHLDMQYIVDDMEYVYEYYKTYGLSKSTLRSFGILRSVNPAYRGYAIPHYINGFLSDVNVRRDDNFFTGEPKYKSLSGSRKVGFYNNQILSTPGLDRIGPFLDHCFIVEAEKDVWILTQMGFNAVSWRGPNAYLSFIDNMFTNVVRPLILADNDGGRGEEIAKRVRKAFKRSVPIVMIDYKQPSDMAKAVGVEETERYIREKFEL